MLPSTTTGAMRRIDEALQGVSAIARSGFALILGTLIASGLGMVFWALAARLLTPAQLGIGAALISAITTLSHASQLNLRNLLHRFVPEAGADASKLIHRSYGAAAVMALLLGAGFVAIAAATTPDLAFLGSSPLPALGFVAALLIWTLYALQEAALTARRMAGYVPLQSLAYSLAKIACLAALVVMLPTASAIVIAWVVPALLIGSITHAVMARQPVSTIPANRAGSLSWRQIASFFGWDYAGALATSISLGVAPILVAALSGAADLAPYYLAWSVTYMLYLVSRHVGAAMLAELATQTHRRRAVYAEAIVLTLVPAGAGAALLLLFAPVVMLIFGPHYVEQGTDLLRILALASLPGSLVTVYLAICRAEEQVRRIALLQVTTLAALLAIGIPLTVLLGPIGMAWGWLAAHSIAALLLLTMAFMRSGPLGALDFAADLAAAAQRLIRQLPLGKAERKAAPTSFAMAGRTWTIDDAGPVSLSDATTLVLESAEPSPAAVILKRASSTEGREALEREYASLLRLHGNAALSAALGDLLPDPLHFENGPEEAALLMSKLPGEDARALATRPDELIPALASVATTLSTLPRTAPAIPSTAWVKDWIDAPLARLAAAGGQRRNIAGLADELRRYWTCTRSRLGPAHGDFCLDNLMVEPDGTTGAMRPSGLVDWGTFRQDAPAGFDICTMAVTLRAASAERQLGQVVLDLLRNPQWTDAERAWMGKGGAGPWLQDEAALRAMVLLVWLHHVDANLGKSTRYTTRSYWGRVNVRLVLEAMAPKALRPTPALRREPLAPPEPVTERSENPLIATMLLATGLLAWVSSLPYIDASTLGGLGLIGILPPGIYLAYAAIIAGFCLSLTPAALRTPLPLLFLAALVLLLHGTPAISYETLRYSWAWKHIGVIDYIMRHHSLDPTARYLSAYHNWPGFFLVSAWIANWFSLDALGIANLARFFPTALNLGFVAVLPLLLRNFTQDRRLIWIATALFLAGNWVGQDYFSPQGTTFFLYTGLLALLTGPLAATPRQAHHPAALAGLSVAALTIIVAIIATHQITPLFMLSGLFCLALIRRLNFGYFIFALVAELLWLFYIAEPFIAPELADLLAGFGKVSGETLGRLANTAVISDDQRLVSLASRGLSGVLGLAAIAGIIVRFRAGHRDLTAFVLLASPMPVLFATPYGGEVIFRLYLFATPFLAFFAASLFTPPQGSKGTWRLVALSLALAVMVPAFLLANNGKDAQYRFSPAEVEAADFLYRHSEPGQLLIEGSRSYPSQFRNYENFTYVPLSEELPEIADDLLTAPDRLVVRWLRNTPAGGYVIITRSQKAVFDSMGLLPPGSLDAIERALIASPDLTIAFTNQDATVLTLNTD